MKAKVLDLIPRESHCDFCEKVSIEAIVIEVGGVRKTIGCDCAARLFRLDIPIADRSRPRSYWRKKAAIANGDAYFAFPVELQTEGCAA